MKAVIVGYGSIGKRHSKNLSKFKNIQCFVVTNRKGVKFPSKNFQKFNSLDECLKLNPDVGFVTNESSVHIKTAIKLANAGCHIFVEKPLSHNCLQIKQLLKLVNKKNLVTLIGCNFRFHPCLIKIKKLISSKKIGRIIFAQAEHGSFLPDWHPFEDYKSSYAARRELGGGVVFTSIHEIDYLFWLFGNVKEVYSITGKFSDLDMNADDLSSTVLRFKNNVIGEIHLDHFQRSFKRGCKIVGTKGTITWDSRTNVVKLFNNKTKKWKDVMKLKNFDFNSTYINEITHFLECVKKNKKTTNDLKEGVFVQNIALAILQSSRNKKMVKLT